MSDSFRFLDHTNTQWTLADERTYPRTRNDLRELVAYSLATALGPDVVEDPAHLWRGPFRLAFSLFDDNRVEVRLREAENGGSTVEVSFRFEMTAKTVVPVLWLTTSVIAVPAVWAWRQWSVRQARSRARRALESIWAELRPRPSPRPYR